MPSTVLGSEESRGVLKETVTSILKAVCGYLNRFDLHRLMHLNAWLMGSGTIRRPYWTRHGLVRGSVSLWRRGSEVIYTCSSSSQCGIQ